MPEHIIDKRVVIVGGGYAGVSAALRLEEEGFSNILLIDRKDYFFHVMNSTSAIIHPEDIDRVCTPYTDAFKVTKFMQGEVIDIAMNEVIANVNDQRTVVPFDFCIIATGQTNMHPGVVSYHVDSKDAKSDLLALHIHLTEARAVCVVGGGASGVEMACQIAKAHPHKVISLIHDKPTLVDQRISRKAHNNLLDRLHQLKINVLLNETAIFDPQAFLNSDECVYAVQNIEKPPEPVTLTERIENILEPSFMSAGLHPTKSMAMPLSGTWAVVEEEPVETSPPKPAAHPSNVLEQQAEFEQEAGPVPQAEEPPTPPSTPAPDLTETSKEGVEMKTYKDTYSPDVFLTPEPEVSRAPPLSVHVPVISSPLVPPASDQVQSIDTSTAECVALPETPKEEAEELAGPSDTLVENGYVAFEYPDLKPEFSDYLELEHTAYTQAATEETKKPSIKFGPRDRVGRPVEQNNLSRNLILTNRGHFVVSDMQLLTVGTHSHNYFMRNYFSSCLDSVGRIVVDQYNRVINVMNVFAIGDCCNKNHPRLGELAVRNAQEVAGHIKNLALQMPLKGTNTSKAHTVILNLGGGEKWTVQLDGPGVKVTKDAEAFNLEFWNVLSRQTPTHTLRGASLTV